MSESMQGEAGPDIVLETGRLRLRQADPAALVGAEIISARTLAANVASQRVMQKCGLQFERCFDYPEGVIAGLMEAERAAVKYSFTRSAWLARRA